ncbi:MAG: M23 family metallopeptidase [Clostridia bacterium]|nr:M23 family metallopeptidase [Clostridia bacterium]
MKQNKKQESIFAKRGFFVTLAVITSLLIITVVMNLILPEEETASNLDQDSWDRAVEQSAKVYDDGLTRVYTDEEAVPVNAETLPQEPEEPPTSTKEPAAPFVMPIEGTLAKDFSAEDLQYSQTMEDWRIHEGIDLAAEEGAEVRAVADGTVELVTEDGMMGVSLLLAHPDGTKTFYGNLQENSATSAGTEVKAGDVIGKIGNTATEEIAEPPHLHFEVRTGDTPQDPHAYLPTLQ